MNINNNGLNNVSFEQVNQMNAEVTPEEERLAYIIAELGLKALVKYMGLLNQTEKKLKDFQFSLKKESCASQATQESVEKKVESVKQAHLSSPADSLLIKGSPLDPLASITAFQNQLEQIVAEMDKSLAINTKSDNLHFVEKTAQELKEMRKNLQRIQATLLVRKAHYLYKHNQVNTVQKIFDKLAQVTNIANLLDREHLILFYQDYGKFLYELKMYQVAVDMFEKSLVFPDAQNDLYTWIYYGDGLCQLKHFEKGESAFIKALQIEKEPFLFLCYGKMLREQGRLKEALEMVERGRSFPEGLNDKNLESLYHDVKRELEKQSLEKQ